MKQTNTNIVETNLSVATLFAAIVSGHRPGRRLGSRRRSSEPIPPRTCLHCKRQFTPGRMRINQKNPGTYCSRVCAGHAPKQMPMVDFHTPESTKTERVRANGLINMRLRRGLIEKPTACDRCGKQKRLDSHHPDYSEPELVAWLCRSCHVKCHIHRDIETEVAGLARHHRMGLSAEVAAAKSRSGGGA